MEAFTFPVESKQLSQLENESKVCVVAVLGKGSRRTFTSKASLLNPIIDADVFKGVKDFLEDRVNEGEIECYYDVDASVIYLHLTCLHDTYRLTSVCQQLSEANNKDFESIWQREDCHYAKSVLLLFQLAHIIVVSHPGSSFDVTYIRLFRIIDLIRQKIQKCMTDQLADLPVSKDWKLNGRPCSPRVLFVFEMSTMEYDPEEIVETSGYRSRPKLHPIKKLQHCMEDQIYNLLRKSRVITNISNNSLFAVPANQEFVYLDVIKNAAADPTSFFLQMIRDSFSTEKTDSDSPRTHSYQTSRRGQSGPLDKSRSPIQGKGGGEFSFKEFLWQHVDTALTKGFDDNVGRHNVAATFELPTSKTWITLASKLYNFFFAERLDSKLQPHFNTLKSLMETDIRFSENRCNKVLPVAESSYQEGLPANYTTHYHLQKLAQAKKVFSQFARGPACDKYLKQLEESCERFWKNGKQLCEDISLTGNPCINALHRTEDQAVTDTNGHLPVMSHSNQYKMKAACNCGSTQADKDDPFNHKAANFDFYNKLGETYCGKLEHFIFPVFEASTSDTRAAKAANYDFYNKLGETCCGKLEHFIFPVFEASTADARAAKVLRDSSPRPKPQHSKLTSKDSTSSGGKTDVTGVTSNLASLSLALSLGQSGGSDMYGHGGQSNCSPFNDADQNNMAANSEQNDGSTHSSPAVSPGPIRQHSTTEYLPGMIHTESLTGLLPKFPSWSLICRGKGSLYNHTQGLDLPGFLTGSNFLLPWDIPVTTEKDKWPSVGESTGKKGKQKKISRTKELMEINLRIYIGEEYECPRGHRFFCSGPEKIIKVSSTSTVKDNANKLIKMDMPLYCQCHCRSSKGYMAQLMRIYVVTPEGPLKVSVNPLVQPNPPPCPIFHPGTGEEIDLTPGHIWVLRLPSVYMGDNGVYTMPTDASQLPGCRLLSGTFNFRETAGD